MTSASGKTPGPARARATAVEAPATPAGMRRLVEAFTRFASRHRLPEGARHDLHVVLDEILSNSVKHARPRGRLAMRLVLSDGLIQATLQDDGGPFNPLEAPRPRTDLPLLQRPVGGLGLLLVRELMDSVTYRRQGGRNRLVVEKRLDTFS